ncbi:uncharacterized protein LOC102780419 [Neolamprologus brichardi]|uniref:uncharacterized protein LOC102780419 n=1 Tax=Neolamprologus brichardi TaxID=32507 RepID=UPI0016439A5F|nr:uncharacterized protein LOC102780419 [Neolamprologus brichardi]
MKVIGAAVLSVLFCTVLPASAKVKTEHRTAFFGEDVHIDVPRGNGSEVIFKSATSESYDMPLITAGKRWFVHVQRSDSRYAGQTMVKMELPDCALEQIVKYGETYYIHLSNIKGPITLEFRPSPSQLNQSETQYATEPPPVVLYDQTGVLAEEYMKRLSVSEKRVVLHSVRMTDEGSFTVKDSEGKVKIRTCLNVRGKWRSELYSILSALIDHSVSKVLKHHSCCHRRLIISRHGCFFLTRPRLSRSAYKLPPLTLAILSLLGVVALMLLACLLSCIYKVHKRNEKNKKLTLIAQQAGKSDGEAFRQEPHTEPLLGERIAFWPLLLLLSLLRFGLAFHLLLPLFMQGLEVSKPGRYHTLDSDNFLEMSDSGVEFTSSGLPLDSDTDAAMTYASHKPLLNAASPPAISEGSRSEGLEATVVPDGDLSASQTPDSALSPISNPHSLAAATPDGSLRGAASPGTASRGTAESDTAKSEGGAESGEGEQKEETAQST